MLVQSSRRISNVYEWQTEYGRDFKKQEAEINQRNSKIADVDLKRMCDEARSILHRKLEA